MKIFVYASPGGHFNEAMMLVDGIKECYHDITIITFDSPEMKNLCDKALLLRNVPWSGDQVIAAVLTGLYNMPKVLLHLLRNRPDVAFTTGSGDLAIPSMIMAKAIGVKIIYVETWTRVKEPSTAGRVLYHFSDVFLVQWEELLSRFGSRARFMGGLL